MTDQPAQVEEVDDLRLLIHSPLAGHLVHKPIQPDRSVSMSLQYVYYIHATQFKHQANSSWNARNSTNLPPYKCGFFCLSTDQSAMLPLPVMICGSTVKSCGIECSKRGRMDNQVAAVRKSPPLNCDNSTYGQ